MIEESMPLDEVRFIDAQQQYTTRQEGTSIKDVIFNHLLKISTICTEEFKEGYWQKKPMKVGDSIFLTEIYKPDTRDSYINAVDYLHDLCLPYFDDKASKNINSLLEQLESLKENIKDKNEWIDYKLICRRKIFQEVSLLLHRLKYFQKVGIR